MSRAEPLRARTGSRASSLFSSPMYQDLLQGSFQEIYIVAQYPIPGKLQRNGMAEKRNRTFDEYGKDYI
jgi:hypothetical protein